MKRIASVIFAFLMVICCSVAGGLVLTACGGKKNNIPKQDEADSSVSATATGNWDSYYASSYAGGSGSSSSPYLISTPEQLARMSYRVNSGYSDKSSYFKLTTDIDISAHYWTPIGTRNYFSGNFSGNDYCIIGMNINSGTLLNATGFSNFYGAGLFGALYGSASIHNFSLSQANINWNVSNSSYMLFSSFVSCMAVYGATVNIYDVRVVDSSMRLDASTYQGLYMGGILGNGCGINIQKCCVIGSEIYGGKQSSKATDGFVGGLVGSTDTNSSNGASKISNCFFNGHIDVYCAQYAGGLVGELISFTDSKIAILQCCYYVDPYPWLGSQYAGSLVGCSRRGSYIRSCFSYTGKIKANTNNNVSTQYVGPLVGWVYHDGSHTMGNCVHCCAWYSGASSLSTYYAYKSGSGTFYSYQTKAYTNMSIPKDTTPSNFYTSSSYLYNKGYSGDNFDFSNVWYTSSSTEVKGMNNSFPVLRGSYGHFSADANIRGTGKTTFGLYDKIGYSSLGYGVNIETWTNPSYAGGYLGKKFIYGQSMNCSASSNIGYQFTSWTGNSQTLSTSSSYRHLCTKGKSTIYANFTGRTYTINLNSNGGVISDMSLWNKYFYGETFKSISYDASSGLNTINFVGVGGWEIIGCPVQVSTNTSYTISFDYQVSSLTPLVSGGGLPIMVVSNIGGGTDETNGNLGAYSLGSYTISTTSSSVRRQSLTFNSGSYSTVYLVINFGHLMDSVNHTIKIGNFTREFGAEFNMTGKKIVQYGSTTGNTLSANAAKKRGYSQDGWYTAGSGVYEIYDLNGRFVSGGRNNYLNDLNKWTRYFGYGSRYSISYNGSYSTFTCTGQGGWEIVAIPLTVSQNTSYSFSFDYRAGSFSIGHHDGVALQVVPSIVDNHMEDIALMTTIITPNSSGTRTVSFNSGSNTTVYLALNGGWFNDGITCSVSVGKFEFSGSAVPQISNYYWTSDGNWCYPGSVTLYARYTTATYNVTLRAGTGIKFVGLGSTSENGTTVASASGRYIYNSSVEIHAYAQNGYTFSGWTITSSHVVSPSLRDRNTQNTILTMPDENVTLTANATANYYPISYNTQGGSNPSGGSSTQTTAAVTNVSVTNPYGYHFKLNAAGYYESTNQGVHSSFAIAKVSFQTTSANQSVYFDYISYGESGCDYAVFGSLDSTLSFDNGTSNGTSITTSSASMYTKTYIVSSTGTHFVYVKYRKDGSVNKYNDSLQFKVRNATNVIVETPMPFVLGSDGYFTSTNNGIHNSYSIARLNFTTNTANQSVTFNVINSGEQSCDYGMISNLDSTFTASYSPDSSYFYKGTSSSTSSYSYTMTVPTAGSHFVYVKYRKDRSVNSGNDSFKVKISNTTAARYNNSYGYYQSLNSTSRTHYNFKGWYTSSSGGSQITSGTTYSNTKGTTLYAQWTPKQVTVNVYLCVIPKNSSMPTASTAGGTVKIEGYQISGASSSFVTLTSAQSSSSATYNVHEGQQFRITATPTNGYVFAGVTSGSTPSITAPVDTVTNYYPYSTSTTTFSYTVYFKQVSANQLKYDETDKYFYFEDGYYPQSEASVVGNDRILTSSFNGVTIFYDCDNDILTLNGAYANNESVGYIMETGKINVQSGRSVTLKAEFLGGSITDAANSRIVFAWDLFEETSNIQRSTGEFSIDNCSNSYVNTLNVTSTEAYFKIFLWRNTSAGGSPVFNNARFRVRIYYDYLSDVATANGESFTYCNGSENVSIPVYSYNGERYVKIEKNGTTKWFKFEPIRWRISDYGVEKTETNYIKYEALRKYTGYATNFTAVSDLILGVGAMHNTREVREGTSVTSMKGFQLVQETTDGCSITFQYAKSGNVIKVDNYSTSSQNNAVSTGTTAYSAPLRIASLEEITSLGLVNKGARASDMVAFILGQDKNNVTYWTRDLSNLGSGVAITPTGTKVQTWLNQLQGMRFAYTFSEGSNAGRGSLEYDTLNYIQSTGTQYIDSEFLPNQDTKVEMNLLGTRQYGYWFGAWDVSYCENAFALCNDGEIGIYVGYDGQGGSEGTYISDQAHKVVLDKNQAFIDNVCIRNYSKVDFQLKNSLYLFAQNRNGQYFIPPNESDYYTPNGSWMKVSSCKIWDNGVLVRDFVPVRRALTGEVGFLDRVSGRFFGNSGTGSFVAG